MSGRARALDTMSDQPKTSPHMGSFWWNTKVPKSQVTVPKENSTDCR